MATVHKIMAKPVFAAFPEIIWKRSGEQKNLYLTFDDGPDPRITPAVLEILKQFKVSALFFLQGEKLKQHREELKGINYQGHRLGNHGYHHVPLLLKSTEILRNEILETDRLIENYYGKNTASFRPPYGIWGPGLRSQLKSLKKDLVLWSLMAYDFKWEADKVLQYVCNNVSGGDIIVFHDNKSSQNVILRILPEFLEYCHTNGFTFQLL